MAFGANSSWERAVVEGGDRGKRRIGAGDSYDPTKQIYKLKFDHVYIADL